MDILLVILGVICLLVGLAGCFLPILPGPPVAYLALWLLHFTGYAEFTVTELVVWVQENGSLHLPAFSASRTAATIKIHYFFRKCNVFYFILCLIFLQTCYKFIQIRILQCILFFVNAAVRACENNLYRCTVRSRDFKCVTPAARRCR